MTILLFRPTIGTIKARPEAPATINFDAIVASAGATHHARFLASTGTTAEDVIGSIDWTIVNTIAWERGPLAADANGGNSAFFNAASPPTYAQATNLITSATYGVAIVFQADKVQEKFVLLNSGTVDGGYSIEVEPDGAGGMMTRYFHRDAGAQVMAATGAVPTSDAVVLFLLQRSDPTNGGRWFYAGNAAGFDLIAADTAIKEFPAVPAGTHYLGAWNLTGGLQAPFQGLIGEVMVWNGSVPNEAQMEAIAAKVQSVVFAQDIDAGSVPIGSALSIEVGAHTNPAEDFTPVKLTDPAAGGGTVAVNGEKFRVTGHATAGNYSFTGRIDRGSLQSGTATISYAVTDPPSTVGITLPEFDYQTHNDEAPVGAIWWNPTSGNDGSNGASAGQAKKTFSAAQAAVLAGGAIVIVGGAHAVPELSFTKSGVNGNPITLMSEPGAEVVLYRDSVFAGALEKTWTWTLVDATRQIWQGPDVGLDSKTVVASAAGVSNAVWGFIRIPDGPRGQPHLQRLMYYDLDGAWEPGAFHNAATGGSAGNLVRAGGYAGPGIYLPGDGRVRIRMQPASPDYTQTEWPTDGRFGQCVDSNGAWIGPGDGADPNDFEIHLTHYTGEWPEESRLFNMNGQSWWHVKGINGALMNQAVNFVSGAENNLFEKCTWYCQGVGAQFNDNSRNNKFIRCMMLSGDCRHISWRDYKAGGDGYWYHRQRTSALWGRFNQGANTGAGTILEHCTAYGFFDLAIDMDEMNGFVTWDHCALLNTIDDGLMQNNTSTDWAHDCYYCYFAGGPPWSGNSNAGVSSRDWHWHHCVIDNRWPMLWSLPSQGEAKRGVHVNTLYPTHSGGGSGPLHCLKMWNCTFVVSPDTPGSSTVNLSTSPNGHNLPTGRAHEVYNCIVAIIDTKRYPGDSESAKNDSVAYGYLCNRSAAGCHRYDYNCYFRSVPSPVNAFWTDIKDSNQTNPTNHTSLAAFRSSAKKTTSESMYGSVSGAFAGSNSTDGHEEHGVQVNPGFVDLAGLDYRPTHASVTSGHLDVSSSGWPGAADAHSWKGALNPAGSGAEVGPQPE